MKRILAIAGAMSFAVSVAAAQDNSSVVIDKLKAELVAINGKMTIAGGVMAQPVLGAPYSATEVNESTQTLADGTKIHNEHQSQVYRDGAGRTRRETDNTITIMDPVAKVRYAVNTERKTAMAMPLEFMGKFQTAGGLGAGVGVGSNDQVVTFTVNRNVDGEKVVYQAQTQAGVQFEDSAGQQAEIAAKKKAIDNATSLKRTGNSEDLGPQTMEGVVAQGTRTTRTMEAGAIGNDRPINITTERWYSPQLQTVMMTRQNDPRSGETIFRLSNVKLGEPDPSLFQVPAGYQVTERK